MEASRFPYRWLLFLGFLVPIGSAAQEPLTLRQAIQQALGENPEVKAAIANSIEAKSNAALARTQLLPQINFTEDISRGNDPVYVFASKLRQQRFRTADFDINSLNRPAPIGEFVSRFSGSWMAFDSFKTQKAIRSADLMKKSADLSARAVNQRVVLDVVQSYQSVLYGERQVAIAQHELDTAQGELALAWAQLRVAMGKPDLQETKLEPIEVHEFPQTALEQELQTAARMRTDLQALTEAQSAQASAVSAARWNYGPRVSAYGNAEQDRPSFTGTAGNSWMAGVQVNIDVMPFGKHAELAYENAAKARFDAQLVSYRQRVQLQVSQAHIQRQTAQLSVETAQAAIDQANESLRILRNRYGAGLATMTELLSAEDAERQSQANYWHAVYGNAMAYAQLLFATGTLTPDAAEELQ